MVESKITCSVDPKHIDSYGHLNNSFFPQYFERGRLTLLDNLGFSAEVLLERGLGLLVSKATYSYKSQIMPNSELEIISRLKPYEKGARFYIEQEIRANKVIAATSTTEHFFYDFTRKRPIKPIEELIRNLRKQT